MTIDDIINNSKKIRLPPRDTCVVTPSDITILILTELGKRLFPNGIRTQDIRPEHIGKYYYVGVRTYKEIVQANIDYTKRIETQKSRYKQRPFRVRD